MTEPPQPAIASMSSPTGAPVRVDWSFLLSHPAHAVALGFGSGLLRPAPGTWGTLAGWLAFVVLDDWLNPVGWLILLVATFIVGALCAQRTGIDLGRADHGAIVIDEILAIWVVLLLLPPTLLSQAFGVAAFRFFDIVKPPPIGAMDSRFKNGFGVMADDLVAAFYALLAAAVLVRLVR